MKNNMGSLKCLLTPKSVALIGASSSVGKIGHDILYNLINAGFGGAIYPINPKADELLGLKSYRDIADISSPPDLAVIVIPAKMVAESIENCGRAGVKAAIIITGGFAEAGNEGARMQTEIAELAGKYKMRVMGPNCQGLNNPHHNLCASWPLLTIKGKMAFISQSGTVGAALMDWASEEQLGVSAFVSLGNRVDVDETDCIEYFASDPQTKVIALYIEGVKRPDAFIDALKKTKKPMVILKSGRTARGKAAAESHTKSMAGNDAIYDAIFEKYRVHRANDVEELYDFSKALAYLQKPRGRRLLHISSSGGAAILAIDTAENLGFSSPMPRRRLQERLRAFLPSHCGVSNPIDLTGDAISNPNLYSQAIATSKNDYDTAVVIFGDPVRGAADIVSGEGEVVAFLGGADIEREEKMLMHKKGIPVFPTPERAIRALHRHVRFEPVIVAEKQTLMEKPRTRETDASLLSIITTAALLKKYGVKIVKMRTARYEEQAADAASNLGYPVALKISSPDIVHKSDVGGVCLNIQDSAELIAVYKKMMKSVKKSAPDARIDGVTISPMAPGSGMEIILGALKDPQFGQVLMFGLGGIFTEIYRDVSFCLLPASDEELLGMIHKIKGAPLLTGIRGQKPKDIAALIEMMKNLSQLAIKENCEQMELNPVLVYEKGALAVDCRMYARK